MGIIKNNFKKAFKTKTSTCKFSSRPSPVRPSPLMSSQLIPSRMSRLRSKTRKVSHPTSRDSFSLESSSKTVEPSPTTTSRRSPLSISFSDLEEVCKSSSRLSLERPSPLMSSQQTPFRTSRPRSKIRRVSHPTSRDSSSLESNLRMEELFQTTTSKRSPPFILFSDSEEVCKSSSRPSLERLSPLMSSQQTPLRMSRPRSKTRRESHPISKDLSSPVSNLRMAELFLTTTSKRSPPFTWSSD